MDACHSVHFCMLGITSYLVFLFTKFNNNMASKSEESIEIYKEWMSTQEQELSDLLQRSLTVKEHEKEATSSTNDAEIREIVDKTMKNFVDYAGRRSGLVRKMNDASSFFSPSWCTSFEASFYWIGGCRPSTFFNLIFALCGSEIDSKLADLSQDGRCSAFPLLSATQLSSVDKLQRKTITEEDKLSTEAASLQQEMTDMPLALIARKSGTECNLDRNVKEEINKVQQAMLGLLEQADQLRISTVRQLFEILTPQQTLEYIIAAKKLRLCIQKWGIERDNELENKQD